MNQSEFPPDHVDDLWQRIPENLRPGLHSYMMQHRPTGGFLRAVLENDLALTVTRADDDSRPAIPDIVRYVYNCAPGQCWGSKGKVADWTREEIKSEGDNHD